METSANSSQRWRFAIKGVVQGVGFRPFVYTLALGHGLSGFVGNDSSGVFIEVEGPVTELVAFREALANEHPPLAHVEHIHTAEMPLVGSTGFTIVHSEARAAQKTLISPDISICQDCLAELFDPNDRRYRYPFTNCTNCGPRFTIVQDIPYDRPLTTMGAFPMCPNCQAEYSDPLNRRFHAQPNACPVCGPRVWLEYPDVEAVAGELNEEPLTAAQGLLRRDLILAVKGLGGFHLACDAASDAALVILRERKGRVDKPFAVMARDVATVRGFAELSAAEEALLTSKERPILLLRKKEPFRLSQLVAPGNGYVGVMLPYTPLHYLLLQNAPGEKAAPVLVMTSGNYSDEPIVKDNEEARRVLGLLADAFLLHDRDIHVRCDDSVIRLVDIAEGADGGRNASGAPPTPALLPLRRSRGYAPFPVRLPFLAEPLLAVGGELKATFCLADQEYAYLSQHIGDMENLETLEAFTRAVLHFEHIFRITPRRVAGDMHPRYLSSQWAAEHAGDRPLVLVQHHHAHVAALMVEHRLDGKRPIIGFSFDGTGYGTDGAIWGGEVLLAGYSGFERAYHLQYLPLAGGDRAVERPYRLALAYLAALGLPWPEALPSVQACPVEEQRVLQRQVATGLNTIPTSSMGRLFDAVASLAGVRQVVTYEGQAAIELEALVESSAAAPYRFTIAEGAFSPQPVLEEVVRDVLSGVPPSRIAARFHAAVADVILRLSQELRSQTGINQVGLTGGVFQNVTLLQQAVALLEAGGFEVLVHRLVPPNDGGLALGQAAVAAWPGR